MRESSPGAEVRRRMLRAGFPPKYANEAARELDEHWTEIVDECSRNGMSDADARSEADARLGSPTALATDFIARRPGASLLNRFPTLTFGLLALLVTILWWVTFGSVAAAVCGLFVDDTTARPPNIALLGVWLSGIRSSSYAALPLLCCHLSETFFVGWKPALWACLVLAIHNAMHVMRVSTNGPGHGVVAWGYSFHFGDGPNLLPMLAPLAVFAIFRAWRMRESLVWKHSKQIAC